MGNACPCEDAAVFEKCLTFEEELETIENKLEKAESVCLGATTKNFPSRLVP